MEGGSGHRHRSEDLHYIQTQKQWKDFQLHQDIIAALRDEGKYNPTRVQADILDKTVNPYKKKLNILIRAPIGSGKTMAFIISIFNSIERGLKFSEDKQFKGKVMKNQIFKPQGIIIVQTNILQEQLQRILKVYKEIGDSIKSEKLNFTIGRMDKGKHEAGDIIVTMPKSFMNRYQRGNLNLDQCKFIAIDEIDDIFGQEKDILAEIIKIAEKERPSVISCSVTMKKQFLTFYEEHSKDFIKFDIAEAKPILEGVQNYYKNIEDKTDMQKFIIGTVFKEQMHHNEDKSYIKSLKRWKHFQLHKDIIAALRDEGKVFPTRVQSETLQITVNPQRKKFNILIRAPYGSGKTLAFMMPILNSIEPGLKTAEDKRFKGRVMTNQIFKPQGIIIVQTDILQDQLQRILKVYKEFGDSIKSEKLNFTIGRMDKEKHEAGDIIVTMPKSFMNRYQRGNLNLDQCKFIAIDEIDYIFEQQKDTLAQIIKIVEKNRPSLISCSVTMKKQFLTFYEEHSKDFIKFDIAETKPILEGVQNYYKNVEDKTDMQKFIIGTVFKLLYEKVQKKPQLFIFFDSIDEIKVFHEYFKSRASDFSSEESQYIANLTVGIIAGEKYEDSKQVEMTISEKTTVLTKFRNNQTNILLATNIIAGRIDMRNACFVINYGVPKISDKSSQIDFDIYFRRLGAIGRHTNKGVALTLIKKDQTERLVGGMEKIYKIDIHEMKDVGKLVDEVKQCIKVNSC